MTLPTPPGSDTYSHEINSEALPNGSYDFRAVAEDRAGNETISAAVTSEVDNPSATTLAASISGVVAPAQKIHFLGVHRKQLRTRSLGLRLHERPTRGGEREPAALYGAR